LVIFGGAGDLTHRLLMPALYNLKRSGLLPDEFAIVGVARADKNDDSFRTDLGNGLNQFVGAEIDEKDRDWLVQRIFYVRGNFDDPDTYRRLGERLNEIAEERSVGANVMFYLATPAGAFAPVAKGLGVAGLVSQTEEGWRRIVVEKPFGHDLASAKDLNRQLLSVLAEDQIYRIDHYLGKETVQNLLVFRFANGIFEPLWNRDHIDHVQITVAETVGVESRGRFYDATGALRDMVPNHLCQLLTMIAMEPPTCFNADSVRTEKAKALDAVQHLLPEAVAHNVVRAQYDAGRVGDTQMRSYLEETNVPPGSLTETYVAMKLRIDNWRWAGVPFYLRTGKALCRRKTEVAIQFKQAPLTLFRDTPVDRLARNDLIMHIQPNEGVTLHISAKVPGPIVNIGDVQMRFNYQDEFRVKARTGYETLIYDCMKGDASLFQRADNIEAGWRVVQPILDAWGAAPNGKLPRYAAGSAGPRESDALLEQDGRHWRPVCAETERKTA
jgi:glucose-6-phosphate 1-dehydrogenase